MFWTLLNPRSFARLDLDYMEQSDYTNTRNWVSLIGDKHEKNISRWFQDAWYKEMYFSNIFVPFAMIFDDFRRFKLFLYNIGVYKKTKLSVPVINVGSITVGGNRKNPANTLPVSASCRTRL